MNVSGSAQSFDIDDKESFSVVLVEFLTEFCVLEIALFSIYGTFFRNAPAKARFMAYDSIGGIEKQRQAVEKILKEMVPDQNDDIREDFSNINTRLRDIIKFRNKIAHGGFIQNLNADTGKTTLFWVPFQVRAIYGEGIAAQGMLESRVSKCQLDQMNAECSQLKNAFVLFLEKLNKRFEN